MIRFSTGNTSPEIRTDTNYIYDLNHLIDHTLGATPKVSVPVKSCSSSSTWAATSTGDHLQMRFLTQFGATATAVPRNDASYNNGQWQLQDAYRYLTEGYAGYHMDVQHGLNLQAGIFMSFIGLYSYYSFIN